MARHVKALKLNIAELSEDDPIEASILDSLLRDMRADISEATIQTSPDGKLKFYVITEDFCGACCHYEYVSFLHRSDGTPLCGGEGIHSIYVIYLLPDGKYLVIQSRGE